MISIEDMSILVVDDMKSMRLTIRKMLKNLNIGGQLTFAGDGREGLEALGEVSCDLAIIDWNMPVMNGIEMLENIRSNKKLRDMPVIMVTAEAEREVVSEVAESEIDGYLLKPLTLSSLDTRIKNVIERVNNPDPATIHQLNARELEEKEDFQGAIDEIRQALTYKPSASRLLRRLGLLHFRIRKNKIAVKCLLKAVSVNRHDVISRVHLGDYFLKKDDLEKAGQYCLEILLLSDRYLDKAFDLAGKLLRRDHRQLALNIFTRIISRSKKSNAARERVIDFCLDNNEYDFPQELLDQSIKENPSNYDMIYKAAVVSQEAGEWEKALALFINVDSHVRGHVDAKFHIAKIYYMNRKILQADDYLNQILRIDPKNEEAIALRREI
ncbi:MAG: response regulator [Desulfobacteraceae bacterium]|nr:response regulator [Desulfobacteraceae bacterium]